MAYSDFADYYDDLTCNVKYNELADYLESLLSYLSHDSGLSLDLACGTGSLTIELKKRGHDIYGIDASCEMLSLAGQKAYENALSILFLCQKMQEIDLYGTIDTCFCCLDSINHLTKKDDVQKTFDRVSLFMNKGGYFIFDVNTVYKHNHILSNNTFIYDTDKVYCVWQNELKNDNIVEISLDFFEPVNDMYIRRFEHFKERAYPLDELKDMLTKSGFTVRNIFDDRSFEKAHEKTQRAFFIAEKC